MRHCLQDDTTPSEIDELVADATGRESVASTLSLSQFDGSVNSFALGGIDPSHRGASKSPATLSVATSTDTVAPYDE